MADSGESTSAKGDKQSKKKSGSSSNASPRSTEAATGKKSKPHTQTCSPSPTNDSDVSGKLDNILESIDFFYHKTAKCWQTGFPF